LAEQAVSRLALPSLPVGISPTGGQMVRVPTWLWIDPTQWTPRTATASVPGMTVTATATPSRVVWSMGDGASVTCAGPGTPWRPGDDSAASSPTCGHTYVTSSAAAPGGNYSLTATVTWVVTWTTSGGQGGTAVPLITVTASPVRVSEVSALVIDK
jgi:hypothetical protein